MNKQTKKYKTLDSKSKRYKETIKEQIYWLLKFYVQVDGASSTVEDMKTEIENNYRQFEGFIEEFGIQKELQGLISTSSVGEEEGNGGNGEAWHHQLSHINMNSIFTEEIEGPEENNLVKIMELQPLIETFNQQQPEIPESVTKITKKLFSDSPLFH